MTEDTKKYWKEQLKDIEPQSIFRHIRSEESMQVKGEYILPKDLLNKISYITNNEEFNNYCYITSIIVLILYKISGQKKIVVKAPLLKSQKQYNNDSVHILNEITSSCTYKNYYETVHNNISRAYKNIECNIRDIIEELEMDSALYGIDNVLIAYDSIHQIIEDDFNVLKIIFDKDKNKIIFSYNTKYINKEYIKGFYKAFVDISKQVIEDEHIEIRNIELINEYEKDYRKSYKSELEDFRNGNTINNVFNKVVKEKPNKNAVVTTVDTKEIYNIINKRKYSLSEKEKILQYLFKHNPHVFRKSIDNGKIFIKSKDNICLVLNKYATEIYDLCSKKRTIHSMHQYTKNLQSCTIGIISIEEPNNINSQDINKEITIDCNKLDGLIYFIKTLWKYRFLDFMGIQYSYIPFYSNETDNTIIREKKDIRLDNNHSQQDIVDQKDIVLVGDKPGAAGVGILYLASYLIRNKVKASCCFVNTSWDYKSLVDDIKRLIDKYNPRIIAISMKWFPHIERVYETARIIKEYNERIKICVGGDTASYFYDRVIGNKYIDYVIRGDGEVPLLNICNGNENIPNVLYKKDNRIVKTPVTYVQKKENVDHDMFLEPIEQVVDDIGSLLFTNMYIPTHRGCKFPCVQCGGSKVIQKDVFCRKETSFWRNPLVVRKDIINLKEHVSAYMFSLDYEQDDYYRYCKDMWEGVDLSNHQCAFFSLTLLSEKLIDLVCRTFLYVRLNIDISSLSQNNRKKLLNKGLTKPQPTNEEICNFLEICDRYPNCHVDIYTICGMPLYEENDIEEDNKFLAEILGKYRCINDLQWGYLHAQPGANVVDEAVEYNMKSEAVTYDDFLQYSKQNMYHKNNYPRLMNYHYPYINYIDEKFNIKVKQHFLDMSYRVKTNNQEKECKKIKYGFITYKELDKQSNIIAYELAKKNINKNDRIVLMIKDRMMLAASIIAVIKMGGVYIPIDHKMSHDRMHQIIEDSNVQVMLTDTQENLDKCTCKCIDLRQTDYQSQYIPLYQSSINDDLYVIYTSGSTGTPKGVPIRQAGVLNYINWRIKHYDITQRDMIIQLLSESFDGFVSNFFTGIFVGASLIMPSHQHLKDYVSIQSIIQDNHVTNTSLVPSMYRLLLTNAGKKLETLRSVILAGEKIDSDIIKESRINHPNIMLVNEYGPTENAVATTAYKDIIVDDPNIIGTPIDNTNVVIVNHENHLMPVGIPGEMAISGIGLFDGYINQNICSSLVEGPFFDVIYKTGDIAEWLQNGNIRFLGREDRQIKLRGIRMELDDIENNICSCYGILQCAVIVKGEQSSNRNCYAYVTTTSDFDMESFRKELENKLPKYLIPDKIIQLDELPITYTGKVDYHSLVSNEEDKVLVKIPVEDIGETETMILELWKKILSKDSIRLDESFFDCGGNSLLLMDLYMALNQQYPQKITVTDLFSYPTITGMANLIDGVSK